MKKLKIGLIGCGARGGNKLLDTTLSMEDIDVVAVCDEYEDRLLEAQNKVLGRIAEMATDLLEEFDYGDTICTISDKASGLV